MPGRTAAISPEVSFRMNPNRPAAPTALAVAILLAATACRAEVPPAAPETPRFLQNEWRTGAAQGERGPGVPEFWVRPGYRVTLAAKDLGEARFLEFGEGAALYLSRPGRGDILTLREKDGAWRQAGTFVSGRPTAHGMCFADGWLWFTQSGAIHKARDTNGDGAADEVVTVIPEGRLPKGGGHWWRSILVTKDHLYTSIGDSGNVSDETATERQKIWRFNKDGTGKALFASGLRNTEKLRLRPGTDEVWGADHGSDWFGKPVGDRDGKQPVTDLLPPDEFNNYVEGGFYGHPFLVGPRIPRIEYQGRADQVDLADRTIPPAWAFGAHWATNGFCFVENAGIPGHKGDAFVACHGSWNRREPAGYRVERVIFDQVKGTPYGSFIIVGTLDRTGRVVGRPVDCAQAPDGAVFFSDDLTQCIYRIGPAGK